MLPELAMDWIVELTPERLYGPTTLGTIRDFLQLGEITEDNFVINACDATRQQIGDIMPLLAGLPSTAGEASDTDAAPIDTSWLDEGDRIRELEEALYEERRARAEVEERYRELEHRYNALLTTAAASTP